MNTKAFEYKPFQRYVTNKRYGYTGSLEKSLGMRRWLVKTLPLGTLVEASANSITQVLNERYEFWCMDCYDSGLVERFDWSTDALLGYDPCVCRDNYVSPWAQWLFNGADFTFIPQDDTLPPF
jgi:hypothetical protein